jgi:hypothetical protein
VQSKAKYDGDKDDAIDAEWEFHDVMQGVDDQTIAQYGKDSNQVQSLGLKKISEYRRGRKKTITSPPQT